MKYAIEGFSQEYATTFRKVVERNGKQIEIKLDCTDLVILRWFVDFYPVADKVKVGGVEYAWVNHKYVLSQLPLLDIKKQALSDRFRKMAEFGILTCHVDKEKGNLTMYGFGEKYMGFVSSKTRKCNSQAQEGCVFEYDRVACSTTEGNVVDCTTYINLSNSSIKDSSTKDSNNPILYSSSCESEKKTKEVKHTYGEYENVKFTDTELAKLKEEFPNDWQNRIENLSGYIASTGKKYTNHLATIRNWARKEQEKQKTAKQPDPNDGWAYLEEQYQNGEL